MNKTESTISILAIVAAICLAVYAGLALFALVFGG
jgi:hypothetical protein